MGFHGEASENLRDRGFERHPAQIMAKRGLAPRSDAGQNFLISPKALDRMVDAAGVGRQEAVLEIGTGLGRLTERLARRAAVVVSVEIDSGLYGVACDHLSELKNVRLIHGDFLDTKHRISPPVTEAAREALQMTGRPLKVVSNLPYSVSSPALMCLLEWEVSLCAAFVTLQAEVVERLMARPGCAQYGPLSVSVDYWAGVRRLFAVPRSAFWPCPKVSSHFVQITPRAGRLPVTSYDAFRLVVNALFQQRRKTLARILRDRWGETEEQRVLEQTGLDPSIRPGELATQDYVAIADVIAQAGLHEPRR